MQALRLVLLQIRFSIALSLQYRLQFVVGGLVSLAWTLLGVVPLYVAFDHRTVHGWTFARALMVVGCFSLVKSVYDGTIMPSLMLTMGQIQRGSLDYVLLRPVDAQLQASTGRLNLWKALDAIAAIAIIGVAFRLEGRPPTLSSTLVAAGLLGGATVILYSVSLVVVALGVRAVRLTSLFGLISAVFELARWPDTALRGSLKLVFTFVIPLGIMTTYPAEALLGRLAPASAAWALSVAIVAALLSRLIWRRALVHYTSASS